jgi:hypothetical protein
MGLQFRTGQNIQERASDRIGERLMSLTLIVP